jgi:hypothetical protein
MLQSADALLQLKPRQDDILSSPPEVSTSLINSQVAPTPQLTCKDLERKSKAVNRASRQQRRFVAVFRTPKWLPFKRRALEIYGDEAASGWKFSITTYNIIPSGSVVFDLAGLGDVDGIQALFDRREASPFDRDEYGLTVLDVSFRDQFSVVYVYSLYRIPFHRLQLSITGLRCVVCLKARGQNQVFLY